MAAEYRMRKWYDHWLVLLLIRGSVMPRTLLTLITALILNALFHQIILPKDLVGDGGGLMSTPSVFTLFTTSAAFILSFATGICYNRFWEALGHMYQMSNRIGLAATLALAPSGLEDEDEEVKLKEKTWRAEFLHDISVLHAVCIQSLFAEYIGAPLDILGGMTAEEQTQLGTVKNQPALVFNWITGSITRRLVTDSTTVMLSNVVTLLTNALTDWNNAMKVSKVPLPLPFQQALAWADLLLLLFTPLTIACFTYNLWVSLALTFCAELIYHGVYMADVAMQQPFGNRSTDLPLVSVHRDFIRRILSFVTPELVEELNQMFMGHAHHRTTHLEPVDEPDSKQMGFKTISFTDFPRIRTYKTPMSDFPLRNKSEPVLSPPPPDSDTSIIGPSAPPERGRPSRATIEVLPLGVTRIPASKDTSFVSAAGSRHRFSVARSVVSPYRSVLADETFVAAPSTRASVDRPPEGLFVGDLILAKEYIMPPPVVKEGETTSKRGSTARPSTIVTSDP
eukprot:Protomagalhaensia_sp_Gyna_25__5891@NODE_892_length_2453_cov_11_539354_g705_i0_p1_GENE_NODE_892_length_2453_cov_11_539354_g705_i0NODE_892_length_2453_cov_11_539354_g705_i0_p1_ORF_typecomplete_len509_score71_00Bestrophin/PF01062_21/4_7e18_NODE_892_length_2453_cov_11_539354_g705_i06712197